jgi:hypothetical protein
MLPAGARRPRPNRRSTHQIAGTPVDKSIGPCPADCTPATIGCIPPLTSDMKRHPFELVTSGTVPKPDISRARTAWSRPAPCLGL